MNNLQFWKKLQKLSDGQAQNKKFNFSLSLFGIGFNFECNNKVFREGIIKEYNYFADYSNLDNIKKIINIKIVYTELAENIINFFENGEKIKVHSSESKQIKYYTDGRVLRNKDALRMARKLTDNNGNKAFFFEKTGNVVYYNAENDKIFIFGQKKHFIEVKDIIETACIEYLESENYLMVHSSSTAIENSNCGTLIIGHTGKGKTTLMLNLIFRSHHKFVSNDRVYLKISDELKVLGAPIQLNIGLGSFYQFDFLEKYIPSSLIDLYKKEASDVNNYKVRFDVNQYKVLFSSNIKKQIKLAYIIIPNLELSSKSYIKEDNFDKGYEILKNNLLSPYDSNHSKWLKLIQPSNNQIKNNIENLYLLLKKNNIKFLEIGIGNDFETFFNSSSFKDKLY